MSSRISGVFPKGEHMKDPGMLRIAILFSFAITAVAQSPRNAAPSGPGSPFSVAIDAEITKIETQFVAVAEAMPEDKFNFSPENLNVQGTELKGVRTFAAQVRHVAADNFAIWAPMTGKPEPEGIKAPNGPEEMKSRQEILKFLRDSFAYSHKAVLGLTSENALELVEFRGSKVTRISLAFL